MQRLPEAHPVLEWASVYGVRANLFGVVAGWSPPERAQLRLYGFDSLPRLHFKGGGMSYIEVVDEEQYHGRPYDELVRLCAAYSRGMHDLADRCMKAEGRLHLIRRNVLMEDGIKS